MSNHSSEIYREKQAEYKNLTYKLKKQLRIISFFRLVFFVGIFVFFFYSYSFSLKLAISGSLICLIIFLLLVKLFIRKKYLFNFNNYLVKINFDELNACQHNYSAFENGIEFINKENDYSFDLDIFGEGSLFQYLNRAETSLGKIKLAAFLQSNNIDLKICEKQEIINEVSTKLNWRQKFIAYGKFLNKNPQKIENLNLWLSTTKFFSNKKLNKITVNFLSGLTVAIIGLSLFKVLPYAAITFTIIYQLIFYTFFSKRINKYHNVISKYSSILKNYSKLFKHIENEDWKSEVIKNKVIFHVKNNKASKATAKLSSLVGMLDTRLNLLLGFLLNWLLLWDLQCIHRIEEWKTRNNTDVNNWFNSLGLIDAFQSLANFKFNHPEYVIPEIKKEEFTLVTENLGHPLLPETVRVCNNFSCTNEGSFAIITGANMAGKSTFLRTVGVNLVLAMAGAPVCAAKFNFTPVKVFSSMRTDDSLQRNKSYFFAELQRLKTIFDKINSGEKLFLILDEILKGTNSKDKEIGSKAFLRKLIKLKANGIIATHDLSLGELEKELPEKITNLCFEVQIIDEKLNFDYKLYQGITKNLNASFLLKKMGII